jgi:hypothetical protein
MDNVSARRERWQLVAAAHSQSNSHLIRATCGSSCMLALLHCRQAGQEFVSCPGPTGSHLARSRPTWLRVRVSNPSFLGVGTNLHPLCCRYEKPADRDLDSTDEIVTTAVCI